MVVAASEKKGGVKTLSLGFSFKLLGFFINSLNMYIYYIDNT